jgi:hypothetical protein
MKTGVINKQEGFGVLSPNISYSSTCSTSNMGHSENTYGETNSISSARVVGFSNYGHFKAPIKRPSCNPIIKDEQFKRLNSVNEGNIEGGLRKPIA